MQVAVTIRNCALDCLRAASAAVRRVSRAGIPFLTLCTLAGLLLGVPVVRGETARVVLRNGDVVTGEVIERTEDATVLRHLVLGEIRIPADQIAPATSHPGILRTSFLAGWDKEIALGVTGSQGDVDEADLRIAGSLTFADTRKRWRIDGRYDLGYSDSDIDDHDAHVTALRDWLWAESRWFAFAYSLYDFDEFEAWKHRTTIGAGPGYGLVRWPIFTLDSRFGPFFTYEFGDEDKARPEAAFGLFANWKFRQAHSLMLSNVYLQTLNESELRNVTRLEWKIKPDLFSHINLRIGANNEYDSASRKSTNNLNYYTAIGFDF